MSKKKNYGASSWQAHFEDLKKQTGLNGWQIYLISIVMFVLSVLIPILLITFG